MIFGKHSVTDLKESIRFEDAHLIVLAKPAGLLSQEGDHSKDPNVVSLLQEYLERPYVGLVHRLDRNTSGLMVIAKRTKSAQRLTEDLQNGRLKRSYLAFLSGKIIESAIWKDRIQKDEKEKKSKISLSESRSAGKEAVLSIRPVGYGEYQGAEFTLAHLELETGRFHQIRAQAEIRGHSLLGDQKYGKNDRAKTMTSHAPPELTRPALHSYTLSFIHPTLKTILEFVEPLPKDLEFLEKKSQPKKCERALRLRSAF